MAAGTGLPQVAVMYMSAYDTMAALYNQLSA